MSQVNNFIWRIHTWNLDISMMRTKNMLLPLLRHHSHGSTIWVLRISFLWSPIPAVAIASIKMQSFFVWRDTVITMFLSTAMDTTTILKRAIPSGIPDGCQPRPIWTLMSVITVWATPPSGAVKMICRQSWPHLFRLERTVRSISWLLPITVKRRKIFLFFLM